MGKLFDFFTGNNLEGKGVKKTGNKEKLNFINYFKMFWQKLNVIIIGNIIATLCNFPLIIAFISYLGYFNDVTVAPRLPIYTNIYGVISIEGVTPYTSALETLFGMSRNVSVITDATKYLMAFAFIAIFTFGFSNVGLTYLMRSCVRRNSVMSWGDFWYSVKKNWKQGLILGILDILIIFISIYDGMFFFANNTDFMYLMLYYVILIFGLIYLVMRNYIYLISITFNLKIPKIFNYSFRLALLGLKRNIWFLVVTLLMLYITWIIILFSPYIGVIFPCIFTFGIICFTGTFTAYPIIEKYMIEPFYDIDVSGEEPVFIDRG